MAGEAEAITRQAITLALGGDTAALRMVMDRIAPPPKDRPVSFALPTVATLADHPAALAALLEAMAAGDLTPNEAGAFAKLLEAHSTAAGLADLESRIAALESRP